MDLQKSDGTILVVEDDLSNRLYIRTVLEEIGFVVLEATNGGEAIRLAEKHLESIALIICDVILPDTIGTLVVKRLTALKLELKVLFISGLTDVSTHGVNATKTNHLQKPFSPEELVQKVQDILDGPGKS